MPRSEASGDATSVYSFTTEDTATSEELARRRPKKYSFYKRFAYQKLNGWRPVLSPHGAEIFFLAAGVLLLALGVPILIASLNVVEYKVPYAFKGPFESVTDATARQQLLWDAPDADTGLEYSIPVLIDKRMEPPIYVAFELSSFFQNFRRYVRSYDPNRMHDGGSSGSPASACQPFSFLGDNDSLPINPCGQIAANFFNDTFRFLGPGGASLALDDSDIAWPSDANDLYGAVPAENYNPGSAPGLRTGNTSSLLLNQNQHWMVWQRPHSQVAIQKLYGQLDTPLEAGTTLTLVVNNRYNTYGFGGDKTVIITTNSWVGGRNNFLGACYIATGGACLLAALYFLLAYDLGLVWKRPVGDLANMSWLRHAAAESHAQQQFAAAASSSTGAAGRNGTSSGHAAAPAGDGLATATVPAAAAADGSLDPLSKN